MCIRDSDTFERPIYAGNAIQTVKSSDAKKVITVRTSTFQATGEGGAASVENAQPAADPGLSTFVGEELSKSDRPELTSAKIIISGGRAMQSRENFTKYIEPVADRLGAAVGASRAAVDAGYAPNDWQVGQTGKVVACLLYTSGSRRRRNLGRAHWARRRVAGAGVLVDQRAALTRGAAPSISGGDAGTPPLRGAW